MLDDGGDTPAALVDVAGPAALAAANVVVLLHHAAPTPGAVTEAVTTAVANLDAAQGALADLAGRPEDGKMLSVLDREAAGAKLRARQEESAACGGPGSS